MNSRSQRTNIVEVLGNVMSSGYDGETFLEVYLDNEVEFTFKVGKDNKLIKLDVPAPSSAAIGCGFAIYTESEILGHGILKEIHIIIDKHTFPGSEMPQGVYNSYVFQNPILKIRK